MEEKIIEGKGAIEKVIGDKITNTIDGYGDEVSNILETSDYMKISLIKELSSTLGLTETYEMLELRKEMLKLISDGESIKHLNLEYEELAIQTIETYKGVDFARGQIALNILKASIYLEAGKGDYYDEDMEDIITYASGMGYEDIYNELKKL